MKYFLIFIWHRCKGFCLFLLNVVGENTFILEFMNDQQQFESIILSNMIFIRYWLKYYPKVKFKKKNEN